MEIRNATISYTKHKAKMARHRAKDIRQQLKQLDDIICNSSLQTLTKFYKIMILLNLNCSLCMEIKGSTLCSGRNVARFRMANVQPSIFF